MAKCDAQKNLDSSRLLKGNVNGSIWSKKKQWIWNQFDVDLPACKAELEIFNQSIMMVIIVQSIDFSDMLSFKYAL